MDDLTGIFEEQGTDLRARKGCWGRCTRPTTPSWETWMHLERSDDADVDNQPPGHSNLGTCSAFWPSALECGHVIQRRRPGLTRR